MFLKFASSNKNMDTKACGLYTVPVVQRPELYSCNLRYPVVGKQKYPPQLLEMSTLAVCAFPALVFLAVMWKSPESSEC